MCLLRRYSASWLPAEELTARGITASTSVTKRGRLQITNRHFRNPAGQEHAAPVTAGPGRAILAKLEIINLEMLQHKLAQSRACAYLLRPRLEARISSDTWEGGQTAGRCNTRSLPCGESQFNFMPSRCQPSCLEAPLSTATVASAMAHQSTANLHRQPAKPCSCANAASMPKEPLTCFRDGIVSLSQMTLVTSASKGARLMTCHGPG